MQLEIKWDVDDQVWAAVDQHDHVWWRDPSLEELLKQLLRLYSARLNLSVTVDV